MEFHEYANIFPLIEGQDFEDLTEDIRQNGLMEPIYTYQNKIIDGRNRFKACEKAEVKPRFQEWNGEGDLLTFIISKNLHRRHLTPPQAAIVGGRIKEIWREQAKKRQLANLKQGKESSVCLNSDKRKENPVHCNQKAAQLMGVGHDSVAKASKVLKKGSKELVAAVDEGNLSIDTAAEISNLPHEEQKQILQEAPEKIREKAREIKKERKPEKAKIPEKEEVKQEDNKYGVPFPQDCVRLTISCMRGDK